MNINNGSQSIASFTWVIFTFSHTNNNIDIDRPMVENWRASKSKVFIGVLSKFPQLKRSILRIAMFIWLQVYSVNKSYSTYLGMDNLIRWIAAWTADWITPSKLWTTEMKQAINFISWTATKSYPLFEQLGPELQSLYKHISLMFWTPAK